jgi:hypothetical protein
MSLAVTRSFWGMAGLTIGGAAAAGLVLLGSVTPWEPQPVSNRLTAMSEDRKLTIEEVELNEHFHHSVTSPNTSLAGMGFSSETPQDLYDFLRSNISNRTNYFNVTLTAFYSGEHVQPHSLDIDTGVNIAVN